MHCFQHALRALAVAVSSLLSSHLRSYLKMSSTGRQCIVHACGNLADRKMVVFLGTLAAISSSHFIVPCRLIGARAQICKLLENLLTRKHRLTFLNSVFEMPLEVAECHMHLVRMRLRGNGMWTLELINST